MNHLAHWHPFAGRRSEAEARRDRSHTRVEIGLDPDTVSGLRVGRAMFTIGDFAKLGRVSIRMLRHYDAIGLLRPAAVDDATGYRFYEAAQLQRLNRIIALKDLGFTLVQVASMLDDKLDALELAGMLR